MASTTLLTTYFHRFSKASLDIRFSYDLGAVPLGDKADDGLRTQFI